MDYNRVCDDLLKNIDTDLSSIFDQISENNESNELEKEDFTIENNEGDVFKQNQANVFDTSNKHQNEKDIINTSNISNQKQQGIPKNKIPSHTKAKKSFKLRLPHNRPAKSTDFIGFIKRTVPFKRNNILYPTPVNSLEERIQEMGISAAMPKVYANRSSRFIAMGLVEPGGNAFTDKGQEVAAKYLVQRKGYSMEQAKEHARNARGTLRRISQNLDGQKVAGSFYQESFDSNISAVELGYS